MQQNYPKPINPSTAIKFIIGEYTKVIISVINPVGEKIAELVNDHLEPGNYDVKFGASRLSSGEYLY